jgi:rhamnogalacturonyl hydrolase YesR
MKKICIITCLLAAACCPKQESIEALADRVADVALEQCILMEERLTESTMPRSIKDGEFWPSRLGWWCSGFYPGTCWYTYLLTGDERMKDIATRQTSKLRDLSQVYENHDIGFQTMCSFGMQYKITGDESCLPVLEEAAGILASRFNETVGATSSWNRDTVCLVIIDNMMNLELFTWAAKKFGRQEWMDMAIAHANTTMNNHFRDDHTSYHVVEYDLGTGKPLRKKTAQGYADESEWSRGQSWGLYGYTMMYRETGEKAYLEQAEKIADYLLTRLESDPVPNWDFDAPAEMAQKDASAGAVMAAGYAELCTFVADKEKARRYQTMAEDIVRALASGQYFAKVGENCNFLLMHSTGAYLRGSEVDVPLTYADYYFLEAIYRLINLK